MFQQFHRQDLGRELFDGIDPPVGIDPGVRRNPGHLDHDASDPLAHRLRPAVRHARLESQDIA